MTHVVPIRVIKRDSHYPLRRCDTCLRRWRMRETDVATGSIRERSCVSECMYARGAFHAASQA